MRISYIVPVYNAEKYLTRCVGSLLEQNIEYSEIILVDDGSNDESYSMTELYAKNNNKIKVIHQKNKGLSGARNTGMRNAKGEYIIFVDADDWLLPNTVCEVLKQVETKNADVGIADFVFVNDKGIVNAAPLAPDFHGKTITGIEFFEQSLRENNCEMMVWKNIYSRKFLLENDLMFREGYNHEDEEWTPQVYLKAKSVVRIKKMFYGYFINETGISKNKNAQKKNSLDMISNCENLKELSITLPEGTLKNLFQNRIALLYLSAFYKGKLINEPQVSKKFFNNLYLEPKMKAKVCVFKISKSLYYYINLLSKKGKLF